MLPSPSGTRQPARSTQQEPMFLEFIWFLLCRSERTASKRNPRYADDDRHRSRAFRRQFAPPGFRIESLFHQRDVEVSGAAALIDSSTSRLEASSISTLCRRSPLTAATSSTFPTSPRHRDSTGQWILTAPLRGQGSFSFNSAGAREDSVNFMINGINLSDPNQNQITFQPTINTIDEFKIDNPPSAPNTDATPDRSSTSHPRRREHVAW